MTSHVVQLAAIDWTRFPPKLARARECSGLGLGQAGLQTGVGRERLKALEDGRDRPTDAELDRVVACYDVVTAWLLSLAPYDL